MARRRTGRQPHPKLVEYSRAGSPVLPMIARFFLGVVLCALMLVSSFATDMYLGGRQAKIALPAQKPTASGPKTQTLALPGKLYMAPSGALYSFGARRFHSLTSDGVSPRTF